MEWPKYRSGLWKQLQMQARQVEKAELSAQIIAVDSNPKAIEAAEQNLAAAGLAGVVGVTCQPMQLTVFCWW